MELPPIIKTISKEQIVNLFVATSKGEKAEKEFQKKFDEILQYIYDCGREMGLTESLNFVTNEADRERIFNGLAELREGLDNDK